MKALLHPPRAGAALRRRLAERYGAEEVLLTSSGTHALQTALTLSSATAPWEGRTVALPAYTCFDVATAAAGAGVAVTFYDIDPSALVPDAEGVRRALGEGAGVVVVNNLYGFPIDWGWLRSECSAAGALLVEDAAQSLGSTWEGGEGGTFGDLTVLSFGRGKGWTGGGGGALLVRSRFLERMDRDLPGAAGLAPARGVESPRALFLSLAQWSLGRPSLFRIPSYIPALGLGETHYEAPTHPREMGAFAAAAALAHEPLARQESGARCSNAATWLDLLDEERPAFRSSYVLPRTVHRGTSGYLRFPLLTTTAGPDVRSLLPRGRELGLAAAYPTPLPHLAPLQAVATSVFEAPGATQLTRHLFTLPTHSLVGKRDMERVTCFLEAAARGNI